MGLGKCGVCVIFSRDFVMADGGEGVGDREWTGVEVSVIEQSCDS